MELMTGKCKSGEAEDEDDEPEEENRKFSQNPIGKATFSSNPLGEIAGNLQN